MARTHNLPGVSVVEISLNSKLGPMSATYASQASCPLTCRFFNDGCYGEHGPVGVHSRRLNAQSVGLTAEGLAYAEADLIERLTGRNDLRLHVVGDSTTRGGTKRLARACGLHGRKHGRTPFTYTHGWEGVPRADWGEVSVLASCEDAAGLRRARARRYAAALVVPGFPSHRAFGYAGFKVVPCPHQTQPGKHVRCLDCRLCLDDERLLKGRLVIGFEAHGPKARTMPLPVLEGAA
jgi:hypothetical protein